jgi:N-acetylneuraminic acid mutarotase
MKRASIFLILAFLLESCTGNHLSPTPGTLQTQQALQPSLQLTSNTWAPGPMMPIAAGNAGAGAINGLIYVAGGEGSGGFLSTLQIFSPATNVWSSGRDMPRVRSGMVVAPINGKLYAAGGASVGFNPVVQVKILQAYNPATNTWAKLTPLPAATSYACGGAINGKLYVAGGFANSGTLNTLHVYDPVTNAWSTLAPMPTARFGCAAGVINGRLYVAGGENCSGGCVSLNNLESYNPATNRWTKLAPMPAARSSTSGAAIDGLLYVVAGFASSANTSKMQAYNPATNAWTNKAPIPGPARNGIAVAAGGGKLYAFGGTDGSFFFYNSVDIYTP